jgi:hypothetical protein
MVCQSQTSLREAAGFTFTVIAERRTEHPRSARSAASLPSSDMLLQARNLEAKKLVRTSQVLGSKFGSVDA